MKFILIRSRFLDDEILGNLFIIDNENKVHFECRTLELPYKKNQRNVSSVPVGTYPIVLEQSPKYGLTWELKNVPNRSEVKIHQGNYYTQIRGCILVGDYHIDINNDGIIDIRNSMATKIRMQDVLLNANINKTTITIVNL